MSDNSNNTNVNELDEELNELSLLQELKTEKINLINFRNSNLLFNNNLNNLDNNITKKRKEILENNKLKSDLKKSTTFISKIKNLTSENLSQCIVSIETLNLNLYLSEIILNLL